jgi:hypothetical protein
LILVRAALVHPLSLAVPRAEREAQRALETLRRVIWSKLPDGIRAEIMHRESSGTTPAYENLKAAIERQAIDTVHERWGKGDPFETLARAMTGQLDILPRAATDDLIDSLRSEHRREKITVSLRARTLTDTELGVSGEEPDLPEFMPDEIAQSRELKERIKRHPKFRALAESYEACAEGGREPTQAEVAARLGVTERTVRNLLADVRKLAR